MRCARRPLVRGEAGPRQGTALIATLADQGRIQSLDLLRGVAVLGILLLNIVGFALPQPAYHNPAAYGGASGADLAAWAINFVLFDGRMRGLFSFLFGASMLLLTERAEAAGQDPGPAHYRRMAWLLAFGLAHLWLVWDGDILALYAIVGMIALPLRQLPSERMLILAVLMIAMTLMMATGFVTSAAQGGPAAASLVRSFGVPSATEITRELALYRGGYPAILSHRIADNPVGPLQSLLLVGPETLAYMLFGMVALRSGMLAGAWDRARYRPWLLLCLGIALPCYAALAMLIAASGFSLLSVTLGYVAGIVLRPLAIFGWIAAILLLAGSGGVKGALQSVGRMAFTNYLVTSLICTTLFYGYGLGWYGLLSRAQLYAVVAAIWVAMLLWSPLWLAHFRFGPFEWLWRSLSRWSLQPMRRTA